MPSTYADPTLYRSAFMDTVFDPVTQQNEVDPLTPRLHAVINSLTNYDTYIWVDGDRLTTVAWNYHGTTSTWWIILMFNGLVSQTELQAGMSLKIPLLSEIRQAKAAADQPIATLVTI